MLKSFLILFFSLLAGAFIKVTTNLPIPDMVYGLVIVFLLLTFKIIKIEDMEPSASKLISLMPLFLMPTCVKVVNSFDILKVHGLRLLVVIGISFILTMVATGLTVKYIRRLKNAR